MTSSKPSPEELRQASVWQPKLMPTLVACVLGGLLGGVIVHWVHPLFAYKDLPPIDLGASAELVQQHRDAAFAYRSMNYGVELAIVGLTLGLFFGAVAAPSKRLLSMLVGGCAGALAASGGGAMGGRLVAHALFQNQQQTLTASMGLQAIVWGLMIASIVWSVAFVHVGAIRALQPGIVGLLAGIAVAATQFVVSSFLFPAANPQFLVPEEANERVYWLLALPLAAGLSLGLGLSRQTAGQYQLDAP